MIIFGTKTYLIQLAMLNLLCGGCGNPASHSVKQRVTKFTLFFVPLFPISTKYLTQCTFCGVTAQMSKEESDQLIAQGAQPHPGHQQAAQPGAQPTYPPQSGNPYQS